MLHLLTFAALVAAQASEVAEVSGCWNVSTPGLTTYQALALITDYSYYNLTSAVAELQGMRNLSDFTQLFVNSSLLRLDFADSAASCNGSFVFATFNATVALGTLNYTCGGSVKTVYNATLTRLSTPTEWCDEVTPSLSFYPPAPAPAVMPIDQAACAKAMASKCVLLCSPFLLLDCACDIIGNPLVNCTSTTVAPLPTGPNGDARLLVSLPLFVTLVALFVGRALCRIEMS